MASTDTISRTFETNQKNTEVYIQAAVQSTFKFRIEEA